MAVYDYTTFDGGLAVDKPVDTSSKEFQKALQFVFEHSGAKRYRIEEYRYRSFNTDGNGNIVDGFTQRIGAYVSFDDVPSVSDQIDVNLLFANPEVALVEVRNSLGFPPLSPLPRFADYGTPPPSPVGPRWPEKGSNIWHVSEVFERDPDKYPLGAIHTERQAGIEITFTRTSVLKPGGSGGFGGQLLLPAWTIMDRKPDA